MLPAVGNARKNVGFSQLPHDLWQRHAVCGVATNRVAIEKFANLIHHTNPGETGPGAIFQIFKILSRSHWTQTGKQTILLPCRTQGARGETSKGLKDGKSICGQRRE
jgi:hypothetical protein